MWMMSEKSDDLKSKEMLEGEMLGHSLNMAQLGV